MSIFSTLDAQHTALRDVERQRLERMIGKLRIDVEGKNCKADLPKAGARRGQERRFQPPKRAPRGGQQAPPDGPARRGGSPELPPDGPAPEEQTEGAPSVEVAWLMRYSDRCDDEAAEVAAFLTTHGLDRYVALLTEPGGPGSSLDELRMADEALLVDAGMPATPRRQLLAALGAAPPEPLAPTKSGPSGETPASRPASSSSVASAGRPASSSSASGAQPKWGKLGRAPVGWNIKAPVRTSVTSARVGLDHVDMCCGDDDGVAERSDDDGPAMVTSGVVVAELPLGDAKPPPASAETPLGASRPPSRAAVTPAATPLGGGRRPSSAAASVGPELSRPGSSYGPGKEKACCYECYRQVHAQFAVEVEDSLQAVIRQFCGAECAKRFETSLAARLEREQELRELRGAVLACDAD